MARTGALAVAALIAACSEGGGGDAKSARSDAETVSVTGVVSGVDREKDQVRVRTDDGRELSFDMGKAVTVTLAGGEAQSAVVTEGAPVRVAYRPQGAGGDLVTIDVEPQATNGRGEASAGARREPPADVDRARGAGR